MANKVKKPQTKVIAEGITGKQLVQMQINSNNENRKELRSLSFNFKQINKHGGDLLKSLNVKESELTPKNIAPFFTEKEASRNGYSYWTVCMAVKRYARRRDNK